MSKDGIDIENARLLSPLPVSLGWTSTVMPLWRSKNTNFEFGYEFYSMTIYQKIIVSDTLQHMHGLGLGLYKPDWGVIRV